MTTRDFTANVISASKVVPDGNFKTSKASGVWDINEALDLIKGGNWPNAANLSPDTFVDALFQATIWDGNGSNQTITNNIDISSKGGLVWIKTRDQGLVNGLFDTERGIGSSFAYRLISDDTGAQSELADGLSSFNSNGFTLGNSTAVNGNTYEYVGWTFRKQPKFFDVVKITGTGGSRVIDHNLGSVPGMIIGTRYDAAGEHWHVYHRSLDGGNQPATHALRLNSTAAEADESSYWNDTEPTSTQFTVGNNQNHSGGSHIFYLFAHNNNDGGFGEPGDQDIIKCGSYTGTGSAGKFVDLGFEPQFLMIKRTDGSGAWEVVDTSRGFPTADGESTYLRWNASSQEATASNMQVVPSSTGFTINSTSDINGSSENYVYMAIRRGGMQTPSTPSTIFNIGTVQTDTYRTLTNSLTGKLNPDFVLYRTTADGANWFAQTRLMGKDTLFPNTTAAANTSSYGNSWGKVMHNVAADGTTSTGTSSYGWMWARARGYFDVVAYSGTGSARTISHNLGVTPEMMWIKRRDATGFWSVYHKGVNGGSSPEDYYLVLHDSNAEFDDATIFNDTAPTSSVFSVGTHNRVNNSSGTYIAYLFATVAGVSKVGSYTGNDGTTNVDCGFTNGARFVLIKKTNGTGDWVVLDSERGIVDGNTPYLRLNTTDAQDNLGARDIIDPLASGFTINANMGGVNDSGDTFLFYAIAADPS